jgi:hypothetical protein
MVDDLGRFPRPVLGALAAAERLLSRRAGATIVLADPEDLGGSDRSVVARARVALNPFSLPRTLVVKHYPGEPSPGRPDPFPFDTVRLDSPTLDQLLPDYTRHRANVVVIDCPPREQHTAIVRAAMRAASLALYPIAPTPVEYARLAATRAVVGGLPMAVLLTRTVPNAASTTAYRDAMTEAGLWVLKTQVGRREVYAQSFGDNIQAAAGGPYGDAAAELIREGRHRW